MEKEPFSLKKRIRSFGYAFKGLYDFIRQEHNTWIHLCATIAVLLAGWYWHLSRKEWIAIIFCIGLVWTAEAINTCIERMADIISPKMDERIRYIKDLAAGAVLVAAVTALIIGLIVFIPKWLY